MPERDLLPCPFCGAVPGVDFRGTTGWRVACYDSACTSHPSATGATERIAMQRWNQRAH